MSRYNKLGFVPDQIFCENFALPNATNADSTNTVQLPAKKSGLLHIIVCASDTTVELANGASLTITPIVGTTASPATVLPATIITEAVQSDASWAPGEVIADIVVPKNLIGTNTYMKLNFACSGNESADKIEAYLVTY